ncbi:hypothetical protein [Streptomyces populi]|uniref:hypothetical protein n=1 Tax=Streptomyces populi TaxID=2058924 RepID=UPI0013A706A8|nr:hypothetical protein [Streptomyces populi]
MTAPTPVLARPADARRPDPVTDRFVRDCLVPGSALRTAVRDASYPPAFADCWGGRMLQRPLFAPESQVMGFAADLDAFVTLLESVPDRLFDGDLARYCDHLGIEAERASVLRRFAVGPLTRYGRADVYHDGTGFRLLEINMASNLGGTDRSEMQRALEDVPAFRAFARENGLGHVHTGERLRAALAAVRPAHLGGDTPRGAVICGRGGLEKYGHLLRGFTEMMERLGLRFELGELDDVHERGGRVLLRGAPVDVALRFFNVDDVFWDRRSRARAELLFRAHEEERLLLWSPINGSLFSNKGALALLSDPDLRSTLTASEAAVVDRVLPETFLLTPGSVPYCREHRAGLILKPLRDFGGRGIVAGWRLDDREWRAVLEESPERHYVVQRRVVPAAEQVVCPDSGRAEDWHAVWGMFFTPDGYAGTDVRAAPAAHSAVINYGANPHVRTGCVFTYA